MFAALIAISILCAFAAGVVFHRYAISDVQSAKNYVVNAADEIKAHVTAAETRIRVDVQSVVSTTKKL
jgi:hypothetical protein